MAQCEACGKKFELRDVDLAFYERLSPSFASQTFRIPPPRLCPRDREVRRLAYRNERTLYKRPSSLSGSSIISCYSPEEAFPVYSKDEWWSDAWDAVSYGREFDSTRSFFEQFAELQSIVPRAPLINNQSENADYCNFVDRNKNCYLVTSANDNENCYYGWCLVKNRDIADGLWLFGSELCYECVDCRDCYSLSYSKDCVNCSDSAFLFDCRSVRNSYHCHGLRNKEYHVFNEPVTKAEFNKYREMLCGSYSAFVAEQKKAQEFIKQIAFRKANHIISSEDVIGSHIFNSRSIYLGFDVYESRDCAYLHDGLKANDCHDICFFDGTELCYESTSLIGYGYRFTNYCRDSADLFYCDSCYSCRNCFGCIGLRNKEYSPLNQSYDKAQYERVVSSIIENMSLRGEWGEFFPAGNSPFAYNETVAFELYPLSRGEAIARGLKWRDSLAERDGRPQTELPDRIEDTADDIVSKVLTCCSCHGPYKVITPELRLLRRLFIPLPRACERCRHRERVARRHQHQIWRASCVTCGSQVASEYEPGRQVKVACHSCFEREFV